MKKQNNGNKCKLIYNPNAGSKRRMLTQSQTSLEEIAYYFEQYQIEADFYPTRKPEDATRLAKESIDEGYKMVIAAGGDGTVSEIASGLIGSSMPLGILPIGTYMNVARMLQIPLDLEKAIMLIKIGRTRKVDIGKITELDGKSLEVPLFFIEGAGVGVEAQFQKYFLQFERGDIVSLYKIVRMFIDYYSNKTSITINKKTIITRAISVSISNGPLTGASLELAPEAKLNDHKLTLSIFKMSKFELLRYFLDLMRIGPSRTPKIETHQGTSIRMSSKYPRSIHADARIFGKTPATFEIVPNALTVITGYPAPDGEVFLVKRTLLDP